ncbi:MAG TPA: aspartate carbamoyltransferase [Ruminococcaceae bacterium]|nr:aspartate carbamoyltransferase [Oscillospiraceae bacterium]
MACGNLLDLNDCSVEEWIGLINLANDIYVNPRDYIHRCDGRVLATLFYEPSTRTQMSFQAAMLRLGGQIIGFDNPVNSSVSKGETLMDTMQIVSNYADIMVIRHPQEGAARAASLYSTSPVINAGDGGHLHPTQTLTDLVTLSMTKGTLSGLHIGVCGDLKYGRTVHSLLKAMSRFPGNRFTFISTPELALPAYCKNLLNAAGCPFEEVPSIEDCIGDLELLYMTRIQAERFSSKEAYEKQRGVFILTEEKMKAARSNLAVLHPLPRVDEIEAAVDRDPRALYFTQAKLGMYGRMALILRMLEDDIVIHSERDYRLTENSCPNPHCITHLERKLPHNVCKGQDGEDICLYCETKY